MRTDLPTITAIIPTYRRPRLLRRAIRSVLSQTYPHLQLHVYDNASGDETAEVVGEIARDDPRVTYHCHTENIGASANFLYGMQHIDTPFFAFLSDDDCFLPNFFETAMEGFAAYPDAIFSSGGVLNIYEETGRAFSSSSSEGYFRPPEGLLEYVSGRCPPILGTLFRSEVVECVGFINPDIVHSDTDYMCRIAAHYPFVASRRPCTLLMHHAQQTSRERRIAPWLESFLAVRDRIGGDRSIPDPVLRQFARMLSPIFSRPIWYIGLDAVIRGDFAVARESARALRTHFGQRNQALLLSLLTAISARSGPLHQAIGALMSATRRVILHTIANIHAG